MKHINNLLKLTKIPPTRGIRYKQSLHQLSLKNSIRIPLDYKKRPTFRTCTIHWDETMTKYRLEDTTPHDIKLSFKK